MSEDATLDEFVDDAENETSKQTPDSDKLEQEQFGPFTLSTPGEWSAKRLGDIKRLITRGKQPTYDDDGIPVINQECIYWDGWYFENLRYLDEDIGNDWKEKYFPQRGDVILNSTGQGTLGRAQVYPDNQRRAIDSHVTLLRTEEELNPYFHRYFLESHLGQALLYSMCVNGSTGQIELSKTRLDLQPVPLPPLLEQRKIATVLYTVGQAVERTEAIVDRITRIREGLHQILFREWSENTKTDPLVGRYPYDWKLEKLSDIVTITDAEHFTPDYVESGIPVLRPGDLTPGEISLRQVEKRVDKDTYEELTNRHTPSNEDIVYSRSQNFAVASQVVEDEQFCLGQDMVVIEPEMLNETFLLHLLNSPVVRNQAIRRSTGSTFSRVNLGDIRSYKVPIPPERIQEKIAEILAEVEDRIRVEKQTQNQFQRLKRGLLQDLLSGTVRTTDTNIQVPEEVAQYG